MCGVCWLTRLGHHVGVVLALVSVRGLRCGVGDEGVECCGLLGWRRETTSKGDRKNEIQIGGRGKSVASL